MFAEVEIIDQRGRIEVNFDKIVCNVSSSITAIGNNVLEILKNHLV